MKCSLVLLLALSCAYGQSIRLDSPGTMTLMKVKAESTSYQGRKALKVVDSGAAPGDDIRMALVPGTEFRDGVIEVTLSGDVAPGAMEGARGFAGVAFRAAPDAARFECFYLRPTNGRADDQVRRNHSAQYISVPGFPWQRLRKEFPEKYESYVDLVPGEWTKVRIEVQGSKARLYVHGSRQPTLIVNDLKQPAAPGAIGLWVGPGTVAHFADLKLTKQ